MPLRLPRPAIAAAAFGVAAWVALGSVPALAALASPASRADQVRSQEWWLSPLQLPTAWQTTKGAGVTIALLDTGVVPDSPDLAGSVISGQDFTNSGEKPGSPFFGTHGTAMASLIVGHGHGSGDSDGVVGVAPEAKLLSVRVAVDAGDPLLSDSGFTAALPGAIASGIKYAVENGAQVIDLPLDPGQSLSALTATPVPVVPAAPATPSAAAVAAQAASGGSPAEQQAIQFALSKGVILVAPAGDNNGTDDTANFPASYPGVISVGAFDSSITKASFSSRQSYVTLTAPGSGMTAAVPGGSYSTVSSTSAASAIVTGIAALIKSQYPELTPTEVSEALIRGTAIHHPGSPGSGAGTADAARALTAAQAIAAPGPTRAGADSSSSQLPSAPAVPAVADPLKVKLERDGAISLIALVVLLLPTLVYAAVTRQRSPRKARPQAAEPVPAARMPYAYTSAAAGGPVSDYVAPVPTEPGRARPGAPLAARGADMPVAGNPGYERNGDFEGAAVAAPGVQSVQPRTLLPFVRMNIHRAPKVSGSPPWEPAPKPDGALPWAAKTPAPPAQPIPAPTPGRRTGSAGRRPRLGSAPGAGQAAEAGTDGPNTPIYVWNPDSAADEVPSPAPSGKGNNPPGPGFPPPGSGFPAPGADFPPPGPGYPPPVLDYPPPGSEQPES